MLGFDVSDTMRNIRWLLKKHVKGVDMKAPAAVPVEKEPKPYGFMTVDLLLKVVRLDREGVRVNEIAKATDLSPTSVSNILRKKRSYITRPDGDEAIRKWFNARHSHAKARKD